MSRFPAVRALLYVLSTLPAIQGEELHHIHRSYPYSTSSSSTSSKWSNSTTISPTPTYSASSLHFSSSTETEDDGDFLTFTISNNFFSLNTSPCFPSNSRVEYVTETITKDAADSIIDFGTATSLTTDLFTPVPFCTKSPLEPIALSPFPGFSPRPTASGNSPDRTLRPTSTRYATTYKTSLHIAGNSKPAITFGDALTSLGREPTLPSIHDSPKGQTIGPPLQLPTHTPNPSPKPTGNQDPVANRPGLEGTGSDNSGSGGPRSGGEGVAEHNGHAQNGGHGAGGTDGGSSTSSPNDDNTDTEHHGTANPGVDTGHDSSGQGQGRDHSNGSGTESMNTHPESPKAHNPSAIVNNVHIAAGPKIVVIGRQTFPADSSNAKVQAIDRTTFTILPSGGGVVAPGGMTISNSADPTTVPAPIATIAGIVVAAPSFDTARIEIGSSTYDLPVSGHTEVTVSGETFSLFPSLIVAASTTVTIPDMPASNVPQFTATTINGIGVDVGSSVAILDGSQTLNIGPDASTTELVVDGQTITAGPRGISFPAITAAPVAGASIMIADGIALTVGSSYAIIDGSSYSYAAPTQVVIGSETLSIDSNGVVLPSTTFSPSRTTRGPSTLVSATPTPNSNDDPSATASASPTSAASAKIILDKLLAGGLLALMGYAMMS